MSDTDNAVDLKTVAAAPITPYQRGWEDARYQNVYYNPHLYGNADWLQYDRGHAQGMRDRSSTGDDEMQDVTQDDDLRERLAAVQHEVWAHWMRYLFGLCFIDEHGIRQLPALSVTRWLRQMNMPYAKLTEDEKDSDREQADKVLAIMRERQQSREAADE